MYVQAHMTLGGKIIILREGAEPVVTEVAVERPATHDGGFYTWEDPALLNYVPLPPPPRKNVKAGRILSKPKQGPSVCA